jgi:hypothetical protein
MVCYSQTWIEKIDSGAVTTIEYTIITWEQFNRLIGQYKETNNFCRMEYTDVLLIKNYLVISGIRPVLTGYYYLLAKSSTLFRSGIILIYGNSNTGRMELEFYNHPGGGYLGDLRTNSNEYIKRWNQFIGWIKEN